MRSYLPSFALRQAGSLEEVLGLIAQPPGAWRPLAGGTDVMVMLAAGTLRHQHFVNVWGLRELRGIGVADDGVTIGAATTYTELLRHQTIRAEFPLLCLAAADTGGVANQNRGTIGGNIANGSPAADMPPALLVYDAEIEVASVRGRRRIPYDRFHTGYKQMDLAADELITAVRLPRRTGWVEEYRKVGARRAQAISKVCFTGALRIEDGRAADVRLGLGSVAPTVLRARQAERAIRGALLTPALAESAAAALAAELAPIDDIRSTARYRQRVARNLLADFLLRAGTQGKMPR